MAELCPIHGKELRCPSCAAAKAASARRGKPASARMVAANRANVKKRWSKRRKPKPLATDKHGSTQIKPKDKS